MVTRNSYLYGIVVPHFWSPQHTELNEAWLSVHTWTAFLTGWCVSLIVHACMFTHTLSLCVPPSSSSCLPARTMWAGSFSCPSSASLGLMEPDERSGQLRGRGERDRPEVGFNSRESLQALEYLKNVQRIQLRMLCVRVSSPWEETTSGTMKVTYYPAMLGPKRVQIAKVSGYFISCITKYVHNSCQVQMSKK